MIPQQLQSFTFVKLGKKTKKPIGNTWQEMNYDEAQKYEDNVAVIVGKNHIVIDCDNNILADKVGSLFKKTFIVKTKNGYHVYFYCKDFPNKTVLYEDGKHIGEIITGNNLVVVPPSIHPSGRKYVATSQNTNIAIITSSEIIEKLGHLFKVNNKVEHNLDGVDDGDRDNSLFLYACKVRDDGYNYSDAIDMIILKGNRCNPPFPEKEAIKCVRSAYGYPKNVSSASTVVINNPPETRQELYDRLRKWLYLPYTDRVDIILATAISNQSTDKPLWTFLYAPSGDAKSELAGALKGYNNVIMIDKITPHTLATGKKEKGHKVPDLGEELQNKHTILVIKDLACLQTLNSEAKREIWGQFRTLYDGDINSRTGNNVKTIYENCYVTIMACGVPEFRNEQIIKDQLGTREIQYLAYTNKEDNKKKVEKALSHKGKEKQMKQELRETIQGYLKNHPFDENIETPSYITEFIEKQADNLADLRATGSIDWYTGELFGDIVPEIPTRLVQQLDLLYRSLKSYDIDYPDKDFKRIVRNVIRTSAIKIRYDVKKYFLDKEKNTKSDQIAYGRIPIKQISQDMNKSRKTVLAQCNVWCELGLLEQETIEEQFGNTNTIVEIRYFSLKKKREPQQIEL